MKNCILLLLTSIVLFTGCIFQIEAEEILEPGVLTQERIQDISSWDELVELSNNPVYRENFSHEDYILGLFIDVLPDPERALYVFEHSERPAYDYLEGFDRIIVSRLTEKLRIITQIHNRCNQLQASVRFEHAERQGYKEIFLSYTNLERLFAIEIVGATGCHTIVDTVSNFTNIFNHLGSSTIRHFELPRNAGVQSYTLVRSDNTEAYFHITFDLYRNITNVRINNSSALIDFTANRIRIIATS